MASQSNKHYLAQNFVTCLTFVGLTVVGGTSWAQMRCEDVLANRILTGRGLPADQQTKAQDYALEMRELWLQRLDQFNNQFDQSLAQFLFKQTLERKAARLPTWSANTISLLGSWKRSLPPAQELPVLDARAKDSEYRSAVKTLTQDPYFARIAKENPSGANAESLAESVISTIRQTDLPLGEQKFMAFFLWQFAAKYDPQLSAGDKRAIEELSRLPTKIQRLGRLRPALLSGGPVGAMQSETVGAAALLRDPEAAQRKLTEFRARVGTTMKRLLSVTAYESLSRQSRENPDSFFDKLNELWAIVNRFLDDSYVVESGEKSATINEWSRRRGEERFGFAEGADWLKLLASADRIKTMTNLEFVFKKQLSYDEALLVWWAKSTIASETEVRLDERRMMETVVAFSMIENALRDPQLNVDELLAIINRRSDTGEWILQR